MKSLDEMQVDIISELIPDMISNQVLILGLDYLI